MIYMAIKRTNHPKPFFNFLPSIMVGLYIAFNPITEFNHNEMANFLKENFNETCYMSCGLLLSKSTLFEQFTGNYPSYSFEVFLRYFLILIFGFGPLIILIYYSTIQKINKAIAIIGDPNEKVQVKKEVPVEKEIEEKKIDKNIETKIETKKDDIIDTPSPKIEEDTNLGSDEITMRQALRDTMAEEMRKDNKVFILGEEVAEYQGAYKVTQDLLQEFGK